MTKNKPEKVGKIYYWKRSDGSYAMQIVHTSVYSEMDSAESVKQVKIIAAKLDYVAEEDNG